MLYTPPGPDGPSPFSLGDPDTVRRLLAGAGFDDVVITGLERPMWFGETADDATTFISGQFAGAFRQMDPADHDQARADLHAVMTAYETPEGVRFPSACWLITAVAR